MAAVRYRKRKREEQNRMADTLDMLKRDNVELETRVRVLTRELSIVSSKLRRYELRCTCGAGGSAAYGESGDVVVDVLDQPDVLPNTNISSRRPHHGTPSPNYQSDETSGGSARSSQFYAVQGTNGQIMLVPNNDRHLSSSGVHTKREH